MVDVYCDVNVHCDCIIKSYLIYTSTKPITDRFPSQKDRCNAELWYCFYLCPNGLFNKKSHFRRFETSWRTYHVTAMNSFLYQHISNHIQLIVWWRVIFCNRSFFWHSMKNTKKINWWIDGRIDDVWISGWMHYRVIEYVTQHCILGLDK